MNFRLHESYRLRRSYFQNLWIKSSVKIWVFERRCQYAIAWWERLRNIFSHNSKLYISTPLRHSDNNLKFKHIFILTFCFVLSKMRRATPRSLRPHLDVGLDSLTIFVVLFRLRSESLQTTRNHKMQITWFLHVQIQGRE